MMNILIVDDQKPIRDGLVAMLGQFDLEPESIHSAASGLEALSLLRQLPVQLVITDIRMPDMDGLTLIERAREEQLPAEFLIISGYSDFAYAQRAIGLRAKGYLLKPVNREELLAAVLRIQQEIQAGQALTHNLEQASRLARETDRKELGLYMQGATGDEDWIAETERRHEALWSGYRLCILREERSLQLSDDVAHRVERITGQVFGQEGCLLVQHRPQLVLAIDESADPGRLTAALQAAQLEAIAVMTEPHHGLRSLPDAYAEALELYRHSYLFPEIRCLRASHLERLEAQWELPYEELRALFRQLGGRGGDAALAQGLSTLFHKQALQRYPIRYTQQLCRAVVQLLEEYVQLIRPYLGETSLDLDRVRELFDYPGIREYIQALQLRLLRLHQLYIEYKCSYHASQDLSEAIRFIHEHYHRPLDLAMVSNHVSLNYAYFSNLFKKSVGKGFAEYLRDVRLDKARRLLAETDYKVVEVAQRVGYESYKSFTRAFRETMGMQPTEYRQQLRQQDQPFYKV